MPQSWPARACLVSRLGSLQMCEQPFNKQACKHCPAEWICGATLQDRLEQMGAQRRRQKQAEHRQEVERLLQHKRDLYEAARVCTHRLQCQHCLHVSGSQHICNHIHLPMSYICLLDPAKSSHCPKSALDRSADAAFSCAR